MKKTLKWMFVASMTLSLGLAVEAQAEYGLQNFKTVMPGALYRGGSTGGRNPMNDSALQGLCEDGFSTAVFLYGRGSSDRNMSCSRGNTSYKNISMSKDKKILGLIYNAIQNGSGPVYVHCWYGVHASGYIAAVALRQFCGYSAEQAVSYWNASVPKSIRYPKVQNQIRNFVPDPGMRLSGGQASKYCP